MDLSFGQVCIQTLGGNFSAIKVEELAMDALMSWKSIRRP